MVTWQGSARAADENTDGATMNETKRCLLNSRYLDTVFSTPSVVLAALHRTTPRGKSIHHETAHLISNGNKSIAAGTETNWNEMETDAVQNTEEATIVGTIVPKKFRRHR